MPRQRHVEKVAQSATTTWPKSCHFSVLVGSGTFLKQKKLQGCFSFFFCRDENHNMPKLQGRKAYLSLDFIIYIALIFIYLEDIYLVSRFTMPPHWNQGCILSMRRLPQKNIFL